MKCFGSTLFGHYDSLLFDELKYFLPFRLKCNKSALVETATCGFRIKIKNLSEESSLLQDYNSLKPQLFN